jgi:hypothetical protein
LQTDWGVGLRLQSVLHGDCLRLDWARGIQDGATAVSFGFQIDRSFVP